MNELSNFKGKNDEWAIKKRGVVIANLRCALLVILDAHTKINSIGKVSSTSTCEEYIFFP